MWRENYYKTPNRLNIILIFVCCIGAMVNAVGVVLRICSHDWFWLALDAALMAYCLWSLDRACKDRVKLNWERSRGL